MAKREEREASQGEKYVAPAKRKASQGACLACFRPKKVCMREEKLSQASCCCMGLKQEGQAHGPRLGGPRSFLPRGHSMGQVPSAKGHQEGAWDEGVLHGLRPRGRRPSGGPKPSQVGAWAQDGEAFGPRRRVGPRQGGIRASLTEMHNQNRVGLPKFQIRELDPIPTQIHIGQFELETCVDFHA